MVSYELVFPEFDNYALVVYEMSLSLENIHKSI